MGEILSMQEKNFLSRVLERDIDLLVLEELAVSDDFKRWFAARVFEAHVFEKDIGAWHSLYTESGESDLTFVFTAMDGSGKAILVENKIDAGPQEAQGERYQTRGESGIDSGHWQEYRTCIIAPRRYLESSSQTEEYDVEVSYEEIMAFFLGKSYREPRYEYRARVVQEAIEKKRRGYEPEISEQVTEYVKQYVNYVRKKYPDLRVESAKPRPVRSTWIRFSPSDKSHQTKILHQLTTGYVKVHLMGRSSEYEKISGRYADAALNDLELQPNGKSFEFALAVPKIDPITESFDLTRANVEQSMTRLLKLLALVRAHGDL